tara:strand:+ start:256 stop:486 length:231 start_codon:yes stop_codon:yes gene_type:complete
MDPQIEKTAEEISFKLLATKSHPDYEWLKEKLEELTKVKDRIAYLEQQIAAGNRLDGWSLEGAKKELKVIKKQPTS